MNAEDDARREWQARESERVRRLADDKRLADEAAARLRADQDRTDKAQREQWAAVRARGEQEMLARAAQQRVDQQRQFEEADKSRRQWDEDCKRRNKQQANEDEGIRSQKPSAGSSTPTGTSEMGEARMVVCLSLVFFVVVLVISLPGLLLVGLVVGVVGIPCGHPILYSLGASSALMGVIRWKAGGWWRSLRWFLYSCGGSLAGILMIRHFAPEFYGSASRLLNW